MCVCVCCTHMQSAMSMLPFPPDVCVRACVCVCVCARAPVIMRTLHLSMPPEASKSMRSNQLLAAIVKLFKSEG